MTGLLPNLAAVAGILLLATAAGYGAAATLMGPGLRSVPERLGWAFAVGLMILEASAALALAVGLKPGWISFLLLCGLVLGAGRLWRPPAVIPAEGKEGAVAVRLFFLLLIGAGVLLYTLRALTEPMWATDFLAIWGWKGKTIFGAAGLPAWTWRMPELAFTHPEYPLGLPLLYAAISFLLGRWDDHAMALIFPFLQVATALLLAGWLRRRGAPPAISLGAAAALALFEPLYRGFTTGMAEVPVSFFLLLAGTALSDALEGDRTAVRRLALASAGVAALKNEGLLAAATAALLAIGAVQLPWRSRSRIAAAALLPALAVLAAHRILRGPLPLRDFDLGLLRSPELLARFLLGVRAIFGEVVLPAVPALLALALLFWAGRPSTAANRLLALAAVPLAAYTLLPALCVFGPDWLVRTAYARTASALAPLVAAALALRLAPLFDSPITNRPSQITSSPSGGSTGSSAGPAA